MKLKTGTLLKIMHVIAWLAIVGFIVKGSAILISYVASLNNPDGAKNLYMGMDFYNLRQHSLTQYTYMVSLMSAILFLEIHIAYLITRVLSKIKMTNPFTEEISSLIERIGYVMLGTWVISLIHNGYLKWLGKTVPGLQGYMVSDEFLILVGVVFVFAQIFKRGVELQSENELTV